MLRGDNARQSVRYRCVSKDNRENGKLDSTRGSAIGKRSRGNSVVVLSSFGSLSDCVYLRI